MFMISTLYICTQLCFYVVESPFAAHACVLFRSLSIFIGQEFAPHAFQPPKKAAERTPCRERKPGRALYGSIIRRAVFG